MIIPTELTPVSILGATGRAPLASPEDFGAQVGVAAQGLSNQIGRTSDQYQEITSRRRQLDSAQWINNSMTKLRDYYSKWMADPANNSRETYDDDLQKMMRASQSEYAAAAPDKLTAMHFNEVFNNFASSRYESATQTVAHTRLNNTIDSFKTGNDALMQQFRTDRGALGVDANVNFLNGISEQQAMIKNTFGKMSPGLASKLDDQLIADAAHTVMDDNPDLARRILNRGNLTGHARKIIEDQIDRAEDSLRAVNAEVFNKNYANMKALLTEGVNQRHITEAEVAPYFRKSQVPKVVAEWNKTVDIGNRINDAVKAMAPKAPVYQMQDLAKLQQEIQEKPDEAAETKQVFDSIVNRTIKNMEEAKRDPSGYIAKSNPEVTSAQSRYHAALTSKNEVLVRQTKGEYNMLQKKYQGAPPYGDPHSEFYHNVNRDQVSLMSKQEAESNVAFINQSSPGEVLAKIDGIMSINNDPADQAIIMADMVRNGLRGEYWAAYMNRDEAWVKDYIGAIKSPADTKGITPETVEKFMKELNTNPDWLAFASAMPGDNDQRANIARDVKNGILLYAQSLATRSGKSPASMIDYATSQVIKSTMHPVTSNGVRQIFRRDRGDGKTMTDGQMNAEQENLRQALRYINPKDVKLTGEDGRQIFDLPDGMTEEARDQTIRDKILAHGFAVESADGRSVSFYISNGLQSPIELRDRQNAAFEVRRLELPDLSGARVTGGMMVPIRIPIGDPLAPTYVPAPGQEGMRYLSSQEDALIKLGRLVPVYPPTPAWLRRRGGSSVPEAVPVKFDEPGKYSQEPREDLER